MLEFLYPSKCVFCGKPCKRGSGTCEKCLSELKPIRKSSPVKLTEGCVSVYPYKDSVREAVLEYKFRGKAGNARIFGRMMADKVIACGFGNYDLITCVPTNKDNVFVRGYDHGYLLAKYTGKYAGIPCRRIFVKLRPTFPMSGLTPSQRRANILNAIGLVPKADIRGKRILIADDILTSGATLSECARVVLQNGALEVACVTFAKTEKKRKES